MKKMNTAFASAALLMLGLACGVPQEQFDALVEELQGNGREKADSKEEQEDEG